MNDIRDYEEFTTKQRIQKLYLNSNTKRYK